MSSTPESLIARLKRRKIVQWALAYVAGGWALLQVLDVFRETWEWPLALVQAITVLVGIGFFATLIVAWYHGERGQQRVSGPELLMLATLLVIAGAVLQVVRGSGPGESAAVTDGSPSATGTGSRPGTSVDGTGGAGARTRRIAVLPFDNFSPGAEDAYFAGGVTEEITSQLSRIRDLTVLSRVAVERALASELSLEEIGRQLGAGSVLEGSVRMAANRVRITAQLIDVDTNLHVWSQDFDRDLDDIFQIQTDVALAIARALRTTLTEGEVARVEMPLTTNVAAYQLYLRQTELYGNNPTENRQAIGLLREALELDPDFATARARLAWRYVWENRLSGNPAFADTATALARDALAQDPELAAAHYALASSYTALERNSLARESFRRVLRTDPSNLAALLDGSYFDAITGSSATALVLGFQAVILDPNGPNTRWHAGVPLLVLGDDARTEAWLALARDEGMADQRLDLAWVNLAFQRGEMDRARELAVGVLERYPGEPEPEGVAASALITAGSWERVADVIETRGRSAPDVFTNFLFVQRTARTERAFVLAESGRAEAADRLFDEALALSEGAIQGGSACSCRWVELAAIHAYLGEATEALSALERAFELGYMSHWMLRVDPMFAPVRDDPRFADILKRMADELARQRDQVEREGAAAGYDQMIAAGPVVAR